VHPAWRAHPCLLCRCLWACSSRNLCTCPPVICARAAPVGLPDPGPAPPVSTRRGVRSQMRATRGGAHTTRSAHKAHRRGARHAHPARRARPCLLCRCLWACSSRNLCTCPPVICARAPLVGLPDPGPAPPVSTHRGVRSRTRATLGGGHTTRSAHRIIFQVLSIIKSNKHHWH
jgi:hypothetical protein